MLSLCHKSWDRDTVEYGSEAIANREFHLFTTTGACDGALVMAGEGAMSWGVRAIVPS